MSIVIVDYGMANLRSVQKAFAKVGYEASISSDLDQIAAAERIVLPGVGAFRDAIDRVKSTGLDAVIKSHIDKDRPFLGICLGLQMLFEVSEEDGLHEGMGILPGKVIRFPSDLKLKVPHMGWNTVTCSSSNDGWSDWPSSAWFYFVHSYYAVPSETFPMRLEADYGQPFCCGLQRGRLLAVQFHPEKSQKQGMYLLHKFCAMR